MENGQFYYIIFYITIKIHLFLRPDRFWVQELIPFQGLLLQIDAYQGHHDKKTKQKQVSIGHCM